jgi:hypothetical protein
MVAHPRCQVIALVTISTATPPGVTLNPWRSDPVKIDPAIEHQLPDVLALDQPSELVIVHMVTVLDTRKGWRVTVRIQDGWQGATLSHWSRGGSSPEHGVTKAVDDLTTALQEALGYLAVF